jgi:5-oxoprolinase (ATP-hydrolysing)
MQLIRLPDRGGTFTDCLGIVDGHDEEIVVKLLSQDPANYADAPIEGIRRILEKATGKTFPRDQKLTTADFSNVSIRMGTTVATNALLERKGERHALLITKGFKDALRILTQSRPKLFALNIQRPDVLYEDVVEIDERVTIEDYQQNPTPDKESLQKSLQSDACLKMGVSGEVIRVLEPLDEKSTRESLQQLYEKGYRSIAVCLVHSYTFQDHELAIEKIAKEIGFTQISLSSQLLPMIKMTSRGASATADAYLTPVIQRYIQGFRSGFKDGLSSADTRCEFMQSDGGLANFGKYVDNYLELKKMNFANPVDSLVFVRSCLGRQAALWAMRELLSMRQMESLSLGESESPYFIKRSTNSADSIWAVLAQTSPDMTESWNTPSRTLSPA